jgi:hypothetical protein
VRDRSGIGVSYCRPQRPLRLMPDGEEYGGPLAGP